MRPLISDCNSIGCVFDVLNAGEASLVCYVCEQARYDALLWASMHHCLSTLPRAQNLQQIDHFAQACGSGLSGSVCAECRAENLHGLITCYDHVWSDAQQAASPMT